MNKIKKVKKQIDRSVAFGDCDLKETGVAICYTCGTKVKFSEWDEGSCAKCGNKMVIEW